VTAALLDLLPADRRPAEGDAAIATAWTAWLARAAARRPEVTTDPKRVVALLATKLEGPLTVAALEQLDGGELWLAAGCTEGLAIAMARFDADYLANLDRALGHMKLAADRLGEVRQRVREKLLVPEDGVTKLEQYAGRGQLATLVRVVAVRAALDRIRADGRSPDTPDEGDAAAVLADDQASPELAAIKAEHADVFKGAFESAVASLDADARGLLRLHVMEKLGIDAIASLHGVHRSTAARWLQDVRERLSKEIRKNLRDRLGRRKVDIESVIRAVDSQLDLSFSRLLGPS
jgi:RNA polymerase sigma-70 factor (ECF subfamily)